MKKLLKLVSILLVAVMCVFALSGCNTEKEKPLTAPVKIAAIQGPTALSVLKMWDDGTKLGGEVPEYTLLSAPTELVAALAKGDYDIAFLPLNTAAKLFNKGTDYRLVGINSWGNMYVVGTDESVKSISDLAGKTVAVSQQGATPDVVMRYCLQQAGITDSVTLDYTLAAHADLAASVISGGSTIALIPEPFVSNIIDKNPNVKILLDLQQLWGNATGGEPLIAQSAVVVKGSFADEYPTAVSEFVTAQKSSADFANSDPTTLAALAKTHGVTLPQVAIINGTARCNIDFKTTAEARTQIDSYLNTILGFSPDDIGGAMPSENFFAAAGK